MKTGQIDIFAAVFLILLFIANLFEGSILTALSWGLPIIVISALLFQFRHTGLFAYWAAIASQALVAL